MRDRQTHAGWILLFMSVQMKVRWLGHLEQRQLRALMKHAGVLVFPSEREGLPLTVIEAHGMGLPVIAQPKSSLPELITDGVNGRLIDVADVDGWCEAVSGYLGTGESARESLAREIRACAVGQYDWPVIGRRYAELYHRLGER